ncbi:MAG: hypothetical protein NZ992_00010 [Candidatus Korarchaeum sp.]|nr:hypothetical protein [Candidatus Korarchaeum sp.]
MPARYQRIRGSWRVNASYDELYAFLVGEYRERKRRASRRKGKKARASMLNLATLLVALTNGCRVGEAVEAIKGFLRDGNREQYVAVEKRKADRSTRLVVIPSVIASSDLPILREQYESEGLRKEGVKSWASKRLGVNCHALRHAFIMKQVVEENKNPALVASMISWKNLSSLMAYIDKSQGEEELRRIVGRRKT